MLAQNWNCCPERQVINYFQVVGGSDKMERLNADLQQKREKGEKVDTG